ncbi:MAG: energy transducer TonB [Pirellulales bacterium]
MSVHAPPLATPDVGEFDAAPWSPAGATPEHTAAAGVQIVELSGPSPARGHEVVRRSIAAATASMLVHGGALLAAWHYWIVPSAAWRLDLERGDNRSALVASIDAKAGAAEPWESKVDVVVRPASQPSRVPKPGSGEMKTPTTATRQEQVAVAVRPDDATTAMTVEAAAPLQVEETLRKTASDTPGQWEVLDDVSRPPPRSRRSAELTHEQASAQFTSVASSSSTESSGADVPQAPQAVRIVKASYPYESRLAREQGTVKLRVRVDQRGAVVEASVAASSGYPRLDAAALAAMRLWQFTPTTPDAPPTAAEFYSDITFTLPTGR